jgi:hypothetical protein
MALIVNWMIDDRQVEAMPAAGLPGQRSWSLVGMTAA